ncbi:MAG: ABC transporter permease [Bacteroidales bacterium]
MEDEFPEVEASLRVAFYFGFLACRNEENGFNERSALFVDPNFFQFFSFPLIHGTFGNCLPDPHAVVLSESAAHKYFGDENPLGKALEIGDGRMHTVTAVFSDFPVNSNFRGDILLPLESISEMTQIWIDPGWEHHSDINTFVRLAKGTTPSRLAGKTQSFLSGHLQNSGPELHFQSMSALHTNRKFLWESNPQSQPRASSGFCRSSQSLILGSRPSIFYSCTSGSPPSLGPPAPGSGRSMERPG